LWWVFFGGWGLESTCVFLKGVWWWVWGGGGLDPVE